MWHCYEIFIWAPGSDTYGFKPQISRIQPGTSQYWIRTHKYNTGLQLVMDRASMRLLANAVLRQMALSDIKDHQILPGLKFKFLIIVIQRITPYCSLVNEYQCLEQHNAYISGTEGLNPWRWKQYVSPEQQYPSTRLLQHRWCSMNLYCCENLKSY